MWPGLPFMTMQFDLESITSPQGNSFCPGTLIKPHVNCCTVQWIFCWAFTITIAVIWSKNPKLAYSTDNKYSTNVSYSLSYQYTGNGTVFYEGRLFLHVPLSKVDTAMNWLSRDISKWTIGADNRGRKCRTSGASTVHLTSTCSFPPL